MNYNASICKYGASWTSSGKSMKVVVEAMSISQAREKREFVEWPLRELLLGWVLLKLKKNLGDFLHKPVGMITYNNINSEML